MGKEEQSTNCCIVQNCHVVSAAAAMPCQKKYIYEQGTRSLLYIADSFRSFYLS